MPNTRSAARRARQAERRRRRNQAAKSRMRTFIRRFRRAVQAGDLAASHLELRQAVKVIDQTAAKGIIHKNTASRYKSRLTRLLVRATRAAESQVAEAAAPETRDQAG